MAYVIFVEPEVISDIQDAVTYYERCQKGLGVRFESVVNEHISLLRDNPFYQIRYDQVHCLPIRKFPFMFHYTVDELKKQVIIRAVFHTSLDPKKWEKRK
ncbi:MAG: hypothetical protein ACPGLV_08900 [Bacteroidia bacterium]